MLVIYDPQTLVIQHVMFEYPEDYKPSEDHYVRACRTAPLHELEVRRAENGLVTIHHLDENITHSGEPAKVLKPDADLLRQLCSRQIEEHFDSLLETHALHAPRYAAKMLSAQSDQPHQALVLEAEHKSITIDVLKQAIIGRAEQTVSDLMFIEQSRQSERLYLKLLNTVEDLQSFLDKYQ